MKTIQFLFKGPGFFNKTNPKSKSLIVSVSFDGETKTIQKIDSSESENSTQKRLLFANKNEFFQSINDIVKNSLLVPSEAVSELIFGSISNLKARKYSRTLKFSLDDYDKILEHLVNLKTSSVGCLITINKMSLAFRHLVSGNVFHKMENKPLVDAAKALSNVLMPLQREIEKIADMELSANFFNIWSLAILQTNCHFPYLPKNMTKILPPLEDWMNCSPIALSLAKSVAKRVSIVQKEYYKSASKSIYEEQEHDNANIQSAQTIKEALYGEEPPFYEEMNRVLNDFFHKTVQNMILPLNKKSFLTQSSPIFDFALRKGIILCNQYELQKYQIDTQSSSRPVSPLTRTRSTSSMSSINTLFNEINDRKRPREWKPPGPQILNGINCLVKYLSFSLNKILVEENFISQDTYQSLFLKLASDLFFVFNARKNFLFSSLSNAEEVSF